MSIWPITQVKWSLHFSFFKSLLPLYTTTVFELCRLGVYPFDSKVIKPYDNKTTPETPTVMPTEVTPAVTQRTEDLSAPKIYLGEVLWK